MWTIRIIQIGTIRNKKFSGSSIREAYFCPREDAWVGNFGLAEIQREGKVHKMSKGV